MITIKENFLPQDLIEKVAEHIRNKIQDNEFCWSTSHSVDQIVHEGMNSFQMTPIDEFNDQLKQMILEVDPRLKDYTFKSYVYLWNRNTMLDWHDDAGYGASATIYLNQDWSFTDGGLFVYRDLGKTIAEEPTFNKMILINKMDKPIMHGVTSITPWAKQTRVTIQVRATNV
tara:strand:+ start:1130 stop:1645 length:516 start_codon:yes stop_codon:yes gene_type:complete